MYHHVAKARDGQRLFSTWEEGLALWRCVVGRVVGLQALCLMPDHLHLLARREQRRRLGRGLQAFAQWRNHRRGERGVAFVRQPEPVELVDDQKRQRSVRYVHLNPCRAGLVADPLAWPLSTHRDALGLVREPVVPVRPDALRFHAYVSGDPTVCVEGTELPLGAGEPSPGAAGVQEVLAATSAYCRVSMAELQRRGPARSLAIRAAAALSELPVGGLAACLGVGASTVYRLRDGRVDAELKAIERIVGDGRFGGMAPGELCGLRSWRRYRRLR